MISSVWFTATIFHVQLHKLFTFLLWSMHIVCTICLDYYKGYQILMRELQSVHVLYIYQLLDYYVTVVRR